nr:hypothetical protein BDOA9_0157730 [Bradyrhizobium sp. DOA9]
MTGAGFDLSRDVNCCSWFTLPIKQSRNRSALRRRPEQAGRRRRPRPVLLRRGPVVLATADGLFVRFRYAASSRVVMMREDAISFATPRSSEKRSCENTARRMLNGWFKRGSL